MNFRRLLASILGITACSGLLAFTPQLALAAPATLNFDDVDHATNITSDHYSNLGVRIEGTTFWNGIPLIGHFTICPNNYRLQNDYYYAPIQLPTIDPITKQTIPAPPGPPKPPNQNMLSLDYDRPNTIRFINGQVSDQVSFNVINENGAATAYQALDLSGNIISQGQTQGNSCAGVPVTLTKGSSSGINAVRLWRVGPGNQFFPGPGFIGIDDVTFDLAPAATPPPAPPPAPIVTAPGPFTVSAQVSCASSTTVQIDLNWTASLDSSPFASTPQYVLTTIQNGQFNPSLATNALTLRLTEPSGSTSNRVYTLSTSNAGGTTFATPGSGTTDLENTSFSIALPNCTPPPPGPFTGSVIASCNGTNPVATLSWSAASGATSYWIYDDGAPGTRTYLTTIQSTDPLTLANIPLSQTNPSFLIDAKNDGGVSSATISTQVPNCAPNPSISLAPINTVCSVSSPRNIVVWTSSDGSAGTLGDFTVLRDGSPIGTAVTSPFTDTTAISGTNYSYTVQSGTTVSNPQSILTTTCPQPPASFQLTITSSCVLVDANTNKPTNRLGWTVSERADNYVVRKNGQIFRTLARNTTNLPTEEILDTDVTSGTTYTYVIEALNAIGAVSSNAVPIQTISCSIELPPNAPPVANDDSGTTDPATLVNVVVLANDSDPDGNLDPTTVRITQGPTNGTAQVITNRTIDYTPNAGFSTGTDSLTYEVCDTVDLCDTAIVTITVNAPPPPPRPPVLPGPLTLSLQNLCAGTTRQHVLTWSVSAEADRYLVLRDSQPLGTVTSTSFVDTSPVVGASYAYIVQAQNDDGNTNSNSIAATTTTCALPPATPTNQPPVASDDTATTPQNNPVVINVLVNDVDLDGQINPACTIVITPAGHGTTSVNPANGQITYTPTTGFTGTDTFIYEMCDNNGLKDTAAVTVLVQAPPPAPVPPATAPVPPAVNRPPVADDDAGTTPHNRPITIDILANDRDPDGNLDIACTKITRQPARGTVTIETTTGRATYVPANGSSGTDTFEYSICDKLGTSDTATVTIAVGQAPPAVLASTGIPIFGFLIDLWNRFLALIGLR